MNAASLGHFGRNWSATWRSIALAWARSGCRKAWRSAAATMLCWVFLDPTQAAPRQALQKRRPKRLGFGGADVQPDDLASAVGVGGDRDYRRNRDDAATLALLQVSGVEPQIRPLAGERPVEKRMHALVDIFA